MVITLEIPDAYGVQLAPDELGRRLKLSAALQLFQEGEISAGAAAELAALDRLEFASECHRRGIPLVDYSPSELSREVTGLRVGR